MTVALSVGVPVIAPVEVLSASPDGSDGEIAYERGDVPPAPTIGINEIERTDCARTFVGTTWEATKGPRIRIDVVLELVALFESDTVTT